MLNYSPAHLLDLAHVVVLDLEGIIVFWTKGTEQMYGWSAAEAVGRNISELLQTQYPEPPQEIWARVMRDGEWEGELVHAKRDGTRIMVASHWVLHRDEQGVPTSILEINNDVTQLKLREVELQGRRAQLEGLIGSAMDAIITVDENQRIVLFNAAAERMFRCQAEEVMGAPLERFIPARFRAGHSEHIQTFGRTKVTSRSMGALGAISGLRADGEEFQIEASISQAEVSGRKLFTVILRDITARQRAEEMFRLAVESAPNAMVIANEKGEIVLLNSQAERLFGYTREELIGQSVEMLVPERFRFRHPSYRAGFSAEPQVRAMGAGRDLFGLRKDGSEVPIEIGLNPIRADKGTLVLSSIVDITERKRAEEERERLLALEQRARRDAEDANRLKDEFLATVSHELRTPLTSILGYSSMLRTGMVGGQEVTRAVEAIERNAKAQAQIVNDILEVSRIITGKLRLDLRPVNPAQAVEAAIDAIRPAVEAKGLRLKTSLDLSAGLIMGDPDRLQQIAWNLLSNAVKFTQRGGRVEVSLDEVENYIQFTVRDTGLGIEPEFLPYVFDRFRQADSSTTRQYGGLGLGLSIVRHLVELHGGVVEARSQGAGSGAAFTVTLPIAMEGAEDEPPELVGTAATQFTGRPEAENYPTLDGLRVLVVDDDMDTLHLVGMLFEQCGADVRRAATAREALAVFEEWGPEVLVCDIGMPGEDGYSFIRKVRAAEKVSRAERTPALALTGYARSEDRALALSAGYQSHMAKPIDPLALTTAVAKLARRATAN